MSILTIVQAAAARIGIPIPTAAVTSTDQQVLQLVALANAEGIYQAASYTWQALIKETSFLTVASPVVNNNTVVQGTLATIAPGMKFIINDTMWNFDLRRPVFGPKTPQTWVQIEAQRFVGPWNQYRIQGNNIVFAPAPQAGQKIVFQYVTKNWCTSSDGSTSSSYFTSDSDVALLDEDLMVFGIIWRWKESKNLQYAEDMRSYEMLLADAQARDGGKDVISSNGARFDINPVILVPAGNWGT